MLPMKKKRHSHEGNGFAKPSSSPVPGDKPCTGTEQRNRDRRDRRDSRGYTPDVVSAVEEFIAGYIVIPDLMALAIACWVVAAWLAEIWDRFPHLAVTSPEKRCGKTRLLQLLAMMAPNAVNTTNISPAAIYRLVEQRKPTLLLDEAQSIVRRGSESSEILRELLNAGIDRDAKVFRVGGEGHNLVQDFAVYSPKVVALIGDLDGVLADRCLPIYMRRKTDDEEVLPFRSRLVEPEGTKLHDRLEVWAEEHAEQIAKTYDSLDVFPIGNDRLAELLLPLQAVLMTANKSRMGELAEYARALDLKDAETESPGIRVLIACRSIFEKVKPDKAGVRFLATTVLISRLAERSEEPWHRFTRGGLITAEALANLLRPFGIRSHRNVSQTARGYFAHDFEEPWARYLSPLASIPRKIPSNSSIPDRKEKLP